MITALLMLRRRDISIDFTDGLIDIKNLVIGGPDAEPMDMGPNDFETMHAVIEEQLERIEHFSNLNLFFLILTF